MRRSISTPKMSTATKAAVSDVAATSFQLVSISKTQVNEYLCVVSNMPKSKSFDSLDFPKDVVNSIQDCLLQQPDAETVPHVEHKQIPNRLLEIALKRRRRLTTDVKKE